MESHDQLLALFSFPDAESVPSILDFSEFQPFPHAAPSSINQRFGHGALNQLAEDASHPLLSCNATLCMPEPVVDVQNWVPESSDGSSVLNPQQAPPTIEPNGQGQGRSRAQHARQARARLPKSTTRLACPFYKHDPKLFNSQTAARWRSCTGPGFSPIHRLKYAVTTPRVDFWRQFLLIAPTFLCIREHLYRNHGMAENSCPRCFVDFQTSTKLDQHVQSDVSCEKPTGGCPQGTITPVQQKHLRKRGWPNGPADEAKWRVIYGYLFPNEDVPSPCK